MSDTKTPDEELVSVVIPIYNVEGTLDECLRSVEGQTHAALEIICVNDGSTDSSPSVVREHAARDGRIIVVDKGNEGYGASCNRGVALARGTWVAIVEPDDVLEPTALAELVAHAASLGGAAAVDVVRCAYWRVFERADGSEEQLSCPYRGRVRPRRQPFSVGEGVELLCHHPAIWAGMYRREYLSSRGIRFVEAPGAGWVDNPFLVETLCGTDRIAYLDRPLYRYREHGLDDATAFARRSPLVPLTRWNEMMDAAALARVEDSRVISALALRCVNYALVTVGAVGLDDPEVRDLVRGSLARLDVDAVLGDPRVSPAGRRLLFDVLGLPERGGGRLAHAAYLAREAAYRVRANGLGFALRTARARLRDRE